ncbi:AfsR/SARP family transcriptional regulator [Streptomyces microflavus]
MGRLIGTVFGDEPPDTAVKQVQNSVSALRERLHDSQRRLIVTEESGYRICVRENALDSLQFTKRLADSRRHAAEDDFDQAISMIGSALSLWRGPALDGLVSEALSGPAARLEEQRLGALELSARWRLEVGQHQEVVDELGDLVSSYPLCEGLHAQLITALARCGRRAEALHAFHRLSTSSSRSSESAPELACSVCTNRSWPATPSPAGRLARAGTAPGPARPSPLPGYPPPSRCLQLPDNFRTLFETSSRAARRSTLCCRRAGRSWVAVRRW